MSTRATIQFRDDDNSLFVYRHSDGFPENIIADLKQTEYDIRNKGGRDNIEDFATWFLMLRNRKNSYIAEYIITTGFHGDESFSYLAEWNDKKKKWNFKQIGFFL